MDNKITQSESREQDTVKPEYEYGALYFNIILNHPFVFPKNGN